MDYSIKDKYHPSIKTKMWKNNDLKSLIAKTATISTMATNGASTLYLFIFTFFFSPPSLIKYLLREC